MSGKHRPNRGRRNLAQMIQQDILRTWLHSEHGPDIIRRMDNLDKVNASAAELARMIVLKEVRKWDTEDYDGMSDDELVIELRNTISLPWEEVAGGAPYISGGNMATDLAWLIFLGHQS